MHDLDSPNGERSPLKVMYDLDGYTFAYTILDGQVLVFQADSDGTDGYVSVELTARQIVVHLPPAVTADGGWIVQTPRLPMKANGSGDITAALFTAHLHETGSAGEALGRTASSAFAVLDATLRSGERELRLIAAQDAIASPACEFEVRQVR
mgnify:CR=1 FL=1